MLRSAPGQMRTYKQLGTTQEAGFGGEPYANGSNAFKKYPAIFSIRAQLMEWWQGVILSNKNLCAHGVGFFRITSSMDG
jgi:hypothetical protein